MNVITFFQQQHVLVGGCLCTIKGIIFANQIDVSVTVDIDVFDIRDGRLVSASATVGSEMSLLPVTLLGASLSVPVLLSG